MDIFLSILHTIGVYFHAAILYLFDDNGVRIIRGYLILIIVDTILGTVRSAKKSRLKSRTYLYGIFLKLLGILSIVVANVMTNTDKYELYDENQVAEMAEGSNEDFETLADELFGDYGMFDHYETFNSNNKKYVLVTKKKGGKN